MRLLLQLFCPHPEVIMRLKTETTKTHWECMACGKEWPFELADERIAKAERAK